ncbi:MAG: class I SAM-dependent methyltransferase, partial [Synergistaceae bacterium]|nr:class I SAM-dependent methyltransferase [Synergistaceae bacterium]
MNPQESTLYNYAQLLASCTRARLTGTRGASEIYSLQVLDCLPSLESLPDSGKVIDVGSGGGLPGIVWAVYRPALNITLLDSVVKKCEAVRGIVEALGLGNVRVVCARSEEFARGNREAFDLAGARALASAGVCAELLSPLV